MSDELAALNWNYKRPKVTDPMLEEVRRLASLGLTRQQIYHFFYLDEGKWSDMEKRCPMLVKAVHQGKSRQISKVAGKLNEWIEKGNLTAIIFYLKTQAGWREKDRVETTDPVTPLPAMTLTVNDPVEASKIYQKVMMET